MVNCGNHLRSGIICGGVQASFSFVPTPPRAVRLLQHSRHYSVSPVRLERLRLLFSFTTRANEIYISETDTPIYICRGFSGTKYTKDCKNLVG